MRIGILGSGDVGRALGTGFVKEGHEVKIGSREGKHEKVAAWVAQTGQHASSGTFAEAAAFGEIVVLCTLWSGTENALQMAGVKSFAGKIVIDVTNPLVFSPGKPPTLALGHTDSGGEQVQRWLPDSRVVKAFNTTGNANFYKPDLPSGPPDMFIAGNDAGAKKQVAEICKAFGWGVVDNGAMDGARDLESLCILWCRHGFATGTWSHAFKLLHK